MAISVRAGAWAIAPTDSAVVSDTVSDQPPAALHPHEYPWVERTSSGMLLAGDLVDLTDNPDEVHHRAAAHFDLSTRTPVVALGSNASPVVMREKFTRAGVTASLPWTAAVATGLAVGHSAHVSARGYVPAAPWHRVGAECEVVLAWLSREQVRALDATEPNYTRVQLGAERYPLYTATGHRLDRYHVYRSRWGVLADGRGPLTLLDQGSLVRWLNERIPGDPLPEEAQRAADVLASDPHRGSFPARARTAGIVAPDGLRPDAWD